MHELSVVMEVFDLLSEIMSEQSLKKISTVTVEIGELSGILPDYFNECWKVARLDTAFASTDLILQFIPAVALCACGTEYEMTKNSRVCPACHKTDYTIKHGREFTVKQIEAC